MLIVNLSFGLVVLLKDYLRFMEKERCEKVLFYNGGPFFAVEHIYSQMLSLLLCFTENYNTVLATPDPPVKFDECTFLGPKNSFKQVKNLEYVSLRGSIVRHICLLSLLLIRRKFSIVVTRTLNHSLLILLLAKLTRSKLRLFFWYKASEPEEADSKGMAGWRLWWINNVERFVLVNSDVLMLVSSNMLVHINHKYRRDFSYKSFVAYNTTTQFVSSRDDGISVKPRIVYVGSTARWQKFDDILKFVSVLKTLFDLEFCVITNKPAEAEERAKQYPGVCSNIYSVKPQEIPIVLSNFDFGIIFRENIIMNTVSAPIKFSEYLAAGVYVILTPHVGDYSRLVEEKKYGILVEGVDYLSDAKKVQNAIQEKSFVSRKALIDYARNNFSANINFNKMLQFVH